jgi:hypothetical protein
MSDTVGTDETTRGLTDESITIEHSTVDELIDRLVDVAESLSAGFDRWDERYVSGPSLYVIIVADTNYGAYADPLGENTWPTDVCRVVTEDLESLVTATRRVAFSYDGAVVVTVDGTIQERMVRVKSPSEAETEDGHPIEYADWMGTKHLSAVEISTRDTVLAAVTLSEENGRVTVFEDGEYVDRRRDELADRWSARDESHATSGDD